MSDKYYVSENCDLGICICKSVTISLLVQFTVCLCINCFLTSKYAILLIKHILYLKTTKLTFYKFVFFT